MYQLAKYATATTIYFSMVKRGVVDLAQSADWTPATGDTKISINGGTLANTTNNPVIVAGTNGVLWSLALTTGELTGADIRIQIVDSAPKAVEDQSLTIYAYGNASAKFAFDYSVATQPTNVTSWNGVTLTGKTGAIPELGIVDSGTAQSAATSTTLRLRSAATFADNELVGSVIYIVSATTGAGQSRVITGYTSLTDTATVDAWTTTPTGTIVYIVFASPPASATSLPAVNIAQFGGTAGTFVGGRPEVRASFIGPDALNAAALAADAVAEIQAGLATSANQTAIKTKTDFLPSATAGGAGGLFIAGSNAATTVNITGTISTVTNLTNAPTNGDLTAAMAATVNAQVVDALSVDTYAELSSVPAATSSLKDKITFLFMKARNKSTQTATTTTLRNDGDSATVATSTVGDDGTTFTKGKDV